MIIQFVCFEALIEMVPILITFQLNNMDSGAQSIDRSLVDEHLLVYNLSIIGRVPLLSRFITCSGGYGLTFSRLH